MKTIKLFLIVILIPLFSVAQNDDQTPKDPEAKRVLDAVSAKTKSFGTINADFTFNLKDAAAGIDETQKGNLKIKGDNYRLTVNGQQVISDATTVWTLIYEDKDCIEVIIDDAPDSDEEEDGAINPVKIFSIYESGFKYQYDGISTVEGVKHHSIKLYPIQADDKSFHQVKLLINDASMQIKEITIFQKEGGTLSYTLSKFNGNADVSDSEFTYDTSLGCEVNDMR